MRIVIIGTGNVATVLGRTITAAAYQVVQVYGRTATHAHTLAAQLQAGYTTRMEELDTGADLYLIAVADAAIPAVAASLPVKDKLVVHTAGSVPAAVLQPASARYGILYPLQSLRKVMPQVPVIPLLINANTEADLALLQTLANSLSPQVQVASDEQRLKLHVAAVIVSNFTNHLYTLAEQYCAAEGASFRLLHPLIREVAARLQYLSPRDAQTGPAIRHDTPTIQKHLELLAAHGGLQELYAWFTKSIQQHAAVVNNSKQ